MLIFVHKYTFISQATPHRKFPLIHLSSHLLQNVSPSLDLFHMLQEVSNA